MNKGFIKKKLRQKYGKWAKYYQGNIYKDSFWRVWEEEFKPYRDRSWMRQLEPCKDCKAWSYCEGNGMHLRREDGSLMLCHLHRLGQ